MHLGLRRSFIRLPHIAFWLGFRAVGWGNWVGEQMRTNFTVTRAAWVISVTIAAGLAATPASAVPAFAQQTGQPCQTCHVGAFGPQLTAFGRRFKLNGYTMRATSDFTPPVSAMLVASFVNTAKDQDEPPAPHYDTNNNATIDEISAFIAGGVGDHFGGFSQITYDGVGRAFAWDNVDLRAVDSTMLAGHDVLLGFSVNNSPTTQDVWATLPAWGFPFTDSGLAPGPNAATLISDALAQNVVGTNVYAWWEDSIYTEVGLYSSLPTGFLNAVGVDPGDTNELDGPAPYVRLAWQKDYGDHNFEIGVFGLFADLYPGRDKSAATTDGYTDLGVDASYQFLGADNIYTINTRFISESQDLRATRIFGGVLNPHTHLDEFNINASYYWQNTIGGSLGFFDTWGSRDPLLYADDRTLTPDSSGLIFQIDGTVFGHDMVTAPLGGRLNLRLGLQYTLYTKFNGASTNFDGLGRDASDNNTLRIFIWTAL